MKNLKEQNQAKEAFSLKKYLYDKLFLLGALVIEVIAYLMVRGVISGDQQLINRLTVAGVILMFIYLVKDGLSRKYRYYSQKWGMGPYAAPKDSEPEDDNK